MQQEQWCPEPGGPRVYHHLAGVERLLGELLVTTLPRRHSGGSGTPNDFEAPTVDLATIGRSPGRPACVVENGVGLGFYPFVFGLVRTVAIPTQEPPPCPRKPSCAS